MDASKGLVIYYTLIPGFAVLLALVLGLSIKPKGLMINLIQAFAAGILLAGIAAELLPQLNFSHYGFSLGIAIILGLVLMLILSKLNPDCCSSEAKTAPLVPFVTGFSIEFLINGIVIVLAVLASQLASIITAISLGLCCFVCGLSVTTRFITLNFSTTRTTCSIFLMALLFPIGGALGLFFMVHLSTMWIEDVIAFGLAVLLYIATTDLLLEAFKAKSNWPKVLFYIGFLSILLIKAKLGG